MKESDRLFQKILGDLCDDVLADTQSSAEQTINLSSRFLDVESRHLLDDFKDFYESEDSAARDENFQQMEIIQKGVQKLVNKNRAVRSEINVILSSMQFSELLRQHLEALQLSFDLLISSDYTDTDSLKKAMLAVMHTFDERKAFHEKVLHENMPEEDAAMTQSLIDELIG